MVGFEHSSVALWIDSGIPMDKEEPVQTSEAEPGDLDQSINARELAGQLQQVKEGTRKWQDVCFVQFLGAKA